MRASFRPSSPLFWIVMWAAFVSRTNVLAQDGLYTPSEDVRAAVSELKKMGASVGIDGQFRVISVSLPSSTGRDNKGLGPLQKLPHLIGLWLNGPQFTDDTVLQAAELKTLRQLTLVNTRVTASGFEALKEALPECRVIKQPDTKSLPSSSQSALPNPYLFMLGDGGFSTINTYTIQGQLASEWTLAELQLNDDQLRASAFIVGGFNSTLVFRDKDYYQRFTELSRDAEAKLVDVLTADQMTRLKQLFSQSYGRGKVLSNPDCAKALQLSPDQSAKIEELLGSTFAAQLLVPVAEFNEKSLAVLTDDQRVALKEMLGPPRRITEKAPIPAAGDLRGSRLERFGRFQFYRLDSDHDGRITEKEWNNARTFRGAFQRASVELSLPSSVDEFSEKYVAVVARLREETSTARATETRETRPNQQ